MSKRQLVLVAIDHATDLQHTMAIALSAAKARGADVHVIRGAPHMGAQLASVPQSAEPDGVRVQLVTLPGDPARVIPAYAQLHEATLLVIARDYGSSWFWRSTRVVDDVARQSPMPTLVVPQQPRERAAPGLRRIVTAIDSSVASAIALRIAGDLSRRHGARVTIVHALKDETHLVFSSIEALEILRQLPSRIEATAERLRRRAAFVGAEEVDTEVATGDADRAILETAARREADLIVMGVAHRSWLDRVLFGSTLRRVLRRATVPVLVVPVVAGAQAWRHERVDPISSRAWTESLGRPALPLGQPGPSG